MKVLGVMADAALPAPVLATTRAVAELFRATAVALHVRAAGDEAAARGSALAAGVPFRSSQGPLLAGLRSAAQAPDVIAMVLGSAGIPDVQTLELAAGVRKPIVVVPPGDRQPTFRRILVPLEGTETGRDAIVDVLTAARARGIEIAVVHVHRADALPAVEDQPGHEVTAWTGEFMSRWAPDVTADPIELRVGAPGPCLAEVMADVRPDLVLLSWSGRLEPGRAEVVRHALSTAAAPVMLVREPVDLHGSPRRNADVADAIGP